MNSHTLARAHLVVSGLLLWTVTGPAEAGVVFQVETTVVEIRGDQVIIAPTNGKEAEAALSFLDPGEILDLLEEAKTIEIRIECAAYGKRSEGELGVEVRVARDRRWHRALLEVESWMPWEVLEQQASKQCDP